MTNKIDLCMDGPQLDEIKKDYNIKIDGYTFNSSLFKKNGATDYLEYIKKILSICGEKPVSLEFFADDHEGMINQGKILNNLAKNVYVKIPISFTNGKTTSSVIRELLEININLNITAIFTLEQVKEIINIVKEFNSILSIFVGRIYDSVVDAKKKVHEINNLIKDNTKYKSLWASTRMPYDYIMAQEINSDIITMQVSHVEKLKMLGLDLNEYSLKTVKQFYEDAKSSGFRI